MEPLGTRLKRERERQNMTLDQVATVTKIGSRMLKALEEEHFDQLPGGIFNKGFVRAYARHLGMDEDQAVADYLAETGGGPVVREPEVDLASIAARAEESRSGSRGDSELPWEKLAALLLLVALGLAFWGWRSRKTHEQAAAASSASPVSPSSVPSAEPAASQPNVPAPATPASPQTAMQPAAAPSSAVPLTAASQSVSVLPAGSFTVTIHAHDECWLKVTADGKDTLNETLLAGQQASASAQHEIEVKAGNVGALDFNFNGAKLPPQGATDQVKTLRFGPTGLQPAGNAKNPS